MDGVVSSTRAGVCGRGFLLRESLTSLVRYTRTEVRVPLGGWSTARRDPAGTLQTGRRSPGSCPELHGAHLTTLAPRRTLVGGNRTSPSPTHTWSSLPAVPEDTRRRSRYLRRLPRGRSSPVPSRLQFRAHLPRPKKAPGAGYVRSGPAWTENDRNLY